MIKYYSGSVFNVNTQAKVNTVNCIGVMGAGIALEYKLRYPNMFIDYHEKCKRKMLNIGEVDYYQDKEVLIVNFPTKYHFKYPSKLQWIESGLKNFVLTYKQNNIISIAFPKLGTLNGGLSWDSVKILMEKYLSQIEAEVYICLDEIEEAEGLELKMVKYYNDNINSVIKNIPRITDNQKNILLKQHPINRFWQLNKLDKISGTMYEKIYMFCKNAVESSFGEQMTFLD